MLYRRIELPPEPWTHEDNPEWILIEDDPMYLLVPVEPGYEAAAIALCRWDGWDYSDSRHDEWPPIVVDEDGEAWTDAKEDYRDRAKAIVDAALKGDT